CMIAWDGSPQAARAVRMHLDLIKTYSKVIIAHHPEKIRPAASASGCADAESLSEYLRVEGLSPTVSVLSGDLSDSLLETAAANQVGVLVMGAYGHSRLGEMLFGGTSRAMLRAKQRPSLALTH
ncbi:MAG: universal stress protein, partial [Pseudomonadota bacterium]